MALVVSAAPNVDTSHLAASLAGGRRVMSDPTRELIKAYGFQTLYDMPKDLQLATRRRLIREHAAAVAGDQDLVCDFSVFGWVADWMRWFWHATPAELWDEVVVDIKQVVPHYREIHHLSGGPLRDYDGFHWLDTRNARQIDILLHHLYREYGVADRVRSHEARAAA